MPATNLKLRHRENVSSKITPKKKAKVFQLSKARAKREKKFTLSAQAKEDLVLTYQIKARKMAFSILRRWHARLDMQEVHSVVDLSLCEAVQRFNPSKGAAFLTFLFYHLRGNLIRAVATAAKLNAVPYSEMDNGAKGEDGESGINAIEIAEALSGRDCPLPDEVLIKKELVEASIQACQKLDPLEREILTRIYLQEEQLLDVAASLGYSRCHISRVKRKALESLYGNVKHFLGDEAPASHVFNDEVEGNETRRPVHRRKPRSGQKRSIAAMLAADLPELRIAVGA